jgi:hypothetical protein
MRVDDGRLHTAQLGGNHHPIHRLTRSRCSPIRTGTETGRRLIVSALG